MRSRVTAGLAFGLVLATASPSWAVPAPLPSLGPGQVAVADAWRCTPAQIDPATGTVTTPEQCEVTGWATLPAPALLPNPLPVTLDPAGLPLAVQEVSPAPQSSTSGVCSGSTSDSPSSGPEPSPSASPDTGTEPSSSASPSPSESPAASASGTPCAVTATLVSGQAFGLWLFLGAIVLLSLFAILRREGRAFRG